PEDFEAIEGEMAKIVKEDHPFERIEATREEASEMIEKMGQPYKVERLADIPEGETITFYRCGEFVDLCRGPHVESTADVRAFRLTSVAGSYYRGIETNPMFQRLYGIAARTEKEIRQALALLEEARKRDHRKLGRELDLFSIRENVGPGLIHWHPKGARIRSIIEDFWRQEHFRNGYELLYTPHIGRANLWDTSGHLDFYKEGMFAPMDVDGSDYFIKPMNCPFHIEIYQSNKRSYRDLPLRYAELGTVYRYEKSGTLHGLMRVRGFTQDDAHIFCTPDQVEAEVVSAVQFALKVLRTFGFEEISAYLSTRPAKAVGDEARWDQATTSLKAALTSTGIAYDVDEGGGAFYGPKIDLKIKDAIGRDWQLGTIQFDFNLPDRFDLNYVGDDGKEHRPYMVHRALLGSLERFFGILIEHYGGAFPLWLAPEQVRVMPLTEHQIDYARQVEKALQARDIRVSVDAKSEKVGAKIRRAQTEKIPYMLVLGPKEAESGEVAVRERKQGNIGEVALDAFIEQVLEECAQVHQQA
ncbi:MAG: threonine--tRNA ligase, partial [Kiritimatiellae bacterium]|nr:threonine--tRNA ligase [Kiritimatiellia bacterium]